MNTLKQLQLGILLGAKHLKISENLKVFPKEIFDLAESLEVLDLSGNQLSELPPNFGNLSKLKIVFFSDNLFTALPEVLSDCPQLEMIGFKANQISKVTDISIPKNTRWLILTNNQIAELPESIGNCSRLQKCMLAGNKLTHLPESMVNCRNIELLRLSANQFTTLPEWLFELPKLSWLAMAGNPCTNISLNNLELDEISWSSLNIQEVLGQGASGIISKAILLKDNKEVAVKIFKGEVTSDGLPEDEMNATIGVGKHENIVGLIGKVVNHSDKKEGLVFELIPSNYKNLAGPPSFETCTRDVFDSTMKFSNDQIITILKGISSAVLHIHNRGIMHGDLYAHNILINENSNPLFGDFGGAMLYDKKSAWAKSLEKIEVRAFACLIDDLLQNRVEGENFETLFELRDKCWNERVSERLNFEEIFQYLH
jgi:hypothetical protein